jgi:hypothetical protein
MSVALQLVVPITITTAMLTSSSVAEPAIGDSPDPAAWSAGATYASGARVHSPATHTIYESLQAGNVGKDPDNAANLLWWVRVGVTNRWRMFDESNTSQTTGVGGIDVTLNLGRVYNQLSLLNITGATTVQVTMTDAYDGVVFDEMRGMQAPPSEANWYAYFFDAIDNKTSQLFDLPTYGSAATRIQINGASAGAVVGCGVAVMGRKREFGYGVEAGARVGIQDFSRKERNAFGDYEVTERAFSKRADFTMWLSGNEVDVVQELLASVRATPCIWIGSGKYSATLIYGFYKDFDINIQYADLSSCTLSLEGLT